MEFVSFEFNDSIPIGMDRVCLFDSRLVSPNDPSFAHNPALLDPVSVEYKTWFDCENEEMEKDKNGIKELENARLLRWNKPCKRNRKTLTRDFKCSFENW